MSARNAGIDPYGLRAHNARIANPETKTHSKTYYKIRYYVRAFVRLTVGLLWTAFFVGCFYFAYLALASMYGG
jgi:hypothetical protein